MRRQWILLIAATATAFAAFGAQVNDILELDGLRPEDRTNIGRSCNFRAQILQVSALRPGVCIIGRVDMPNPRGYLLYAPALTGLEEGDVVAIEGETVEVLKHIAVRARTVEVLRSAPLGDAPDGKFYNLRTGKLHARRCAFGGTVVSVAATDGATVFKLANGPSEAFCKIPGAPSVKVGDKVRVTGCVFNTYNESGTVSESMVELSGSGGIAFLAHDRHDAVIAALLALSGALAAALLAIFLRIRRDRLTARVLAAERRRLAGDLHDTIEQHLAGVKILLTCALSGEGTEDARRAYLKEAAQMLIHAKNEVREVVMNLRNDDALRLAPADALRALARQFAARTAAGGNRAVRVRTFLRGLPERLDAARQADLMMIVREAVTNAVKHGHAKTIVIAADPLDAGFVLRILNDGEKFDRRTALGPETGHFGLAGMEERALRSKFNLSFVSDDNWCGVEVKS